MLLDPRFAPPVLFLYNDFLVAFSKQQGMNKVNFLPVLFLYNDFSLPFSKQQGMNKVNFLPYCHIWTQKSSCIYTVGFVVPNASA